MENLVQKTELCDILHVITLVLITIRNSELDERRKMFFINVFEVVCYIFRNLLEKRRDCEVVFTDEAGFIFNPPSEGLRRMIGAKHRRRGKLELEYRCNILVPEKNQDLPVVIYGNDAKDVKACTTKIINIFKLYSDQIR